MFDYHSWCGTVDYSHLKNEKRQNYFRHYTGGPVAIMEFVFLLHGIHLKSVDRKNKYWSRYMLLAGKLVNNVNDVMSLKKELEEKAMDSSVLVHIRNGLDITTALNKSLADHDEALEELREIFFYLKEYKEKKYKDRTEDDEYEILIQAMEICNKFVGPQIKALHLMNRYNKFDYSFV
ncbi:unnamed protein product [Allacma fusca]|nr:unnamed protein product [Allacma fusca]